MTFKLTICLFYDIDKIFKNRRNLLINISTALASFTTVFVFGSKYLQLLTTAGPYSDVNIYFGNVCDIYEIISNF